MTRGHTDAEGWVVLPPSRRPVDSLLGSPRRRVRPSQGGGAIELQVVPARDSGPPQTIVISVDQLARVAQWLAGEGLIQELLQDMTPEEREVVQTGLVM